MLASPSKKYFSLQAVGKCGSGSIILFEPEQLYHLYAFFATQVSRRNSTVQADSETVW
jgi:hypothetical protein